MGNSPEIPAEIEKESVNRNHCSEAAQAPKLSSVYGERIDSNGQSMS